jgi:transporter family protein
MEPWFVLAVLCAFLWGCSDIFAKISTPKLGVSRIAILMPITESVLYFAGFYFWHENMSIGAGYVALAAVSALAGTVAYLCFFESIMVGQIAIAGTISAAFPALTVLGAIALLSEIPTVMQLVGLVAIIGGIVALSYEPDPGSEHATPRRSLLFALAAFALWGFWSLTSKVVVGEIGPGNVFGFYTVSTLTVPLIYAWFRKNRSAQLGSGERSRVTWVFGGVALMINVVGTYFFSFALKTGFASLVVPVSSSFPLVTVTLAVLLLQEKLNRFQLVGFLSVVIGLVMLGTSV